MLGCCSPLKLQPHGNSSQLTWLQLHPCKKNALIPFQVRFDSTVLGKSVKQVQLKGSEKGQKAGHFPQYQRYWANMHNRKPSWHKRLLERLAKQLDTQKFYHSKQKSITLKPSCHCWHLSNLHLTLPWKIWLVWSWSCAHFSTLFMGIRMCCFLLAHAPFVLHCQVHSQAGRL